jgi:hypothetical protein
MSTALYVRSTTASPSAEMSPAVTSWPLPSERVAMRVNVPDRSSGVAYTDECPLNTLVTMMSRLPIGSTINASASCAPSG